MGAAGGEDGGVSEQPEDKPRTTFHPLEYETGFMDVEKADGNLLDEDFVVTIHFDPDPLSWWWSPEWN